MTALVTLDDYKTYKKITKTESDEQIQTIISSCSTIVKTYCGHAFIDYHSTPKVEYINIEPGTHAILMNEWPIVAVSTIETRNSDGTYTVLDASEYFVDKGIDTIFMYSGYWPEGYGAVKITYTAGYSTTPEDVRIATLDLVSHYFKEEYKERKSIGSASIDNTVTSGTSQKWPPHVIRILDMYRNV